VAYGVSEPTVCRTIRQVEAVLAACGEWSLPGKKALPKPELAFDIIVVDATEMPIERPKKNSGATTAARKSVTPAKLKS
jgi:hypothetical protein